MRGQLKTIIVVFGHLSNSGNSGLSFFNHKLAKYFYDQGSLEKIYCLGFDDNILVPSRFIVSLRSIFLIKVIFRILRIIKNNLYFNLQQRLIEEYIFDLYFSLTINFSISNVMINLKPVNPFINNRAKQKDVKIITLGTVAHPVFIYSMIKKLEGMYNVKDFSSYSNRHRIKRVSATYGTSDLVIPQSNSKFIANTFLQNGICPNKIRLLKSNSSIDYNVYAPTVNARDLEKEELTFISVGFMCLKKGLPLLVEAWVELIQEGRFKGRLVIAGRIDESTKKAISKFRPFPGIEFLGHVSDVNLTYKTADVFIAASVSDLLPRTVLEALSCGLPVIISKHCGSADLVETGENGFVYDPFNIKELKELILWYYINKDKLVCMKKNARASALKIEGHDFLKDIFLMSKEIL